MGAKLVGFVSVDGCNDNHGYHCSLPPIYTVLTKHTAIVVKYGGEGGGGGTAERGMFLVLLQWLVDHLLGWESGGYSTKQPSQVGETTNPLGGNFCFMLSKLPLNTRCLLLSEKNWQPHLHITRVQQPVTRVYLDLLPVL